MWRFAWRNLLTRPLRTALALVGLSIPILGVLGLFSLSGGLRNLVGDTLSQIQGVMVLRENTPSPVFSVLDARVVETLRRVPGVRVAAPEVWGVAPPVEGTSLIAKTVRGILQSKQHLQSVFDAIVVQGQEIDSHARLRAGVYPRHMVPAAEGGGRFLDVRDKGKNHVVISRKIARDFAGPDGRTKRAGDTLRIGSGEAQQTFTIVGIYDTGSMFLDVVLVMDIEPARRVLNVNSRTVSSVFVEAEDPRRVNEVAEEIERRVAGVDARSMEEFSSNFGRLLGQLDTFLLMIVSLALLVGVVGIINTMLMSTTERFAEFGILRTNGWSRGNVLALVTLESAYLGLLAGLLGCGLAVAGTAVANQFLGGGLRLEVTPEHIALGLGLSVVMGTLGGLYPAWRAAWLVPMEAIRLGSR